MNFSQFSAETVQMFGIKDAIQEVSETSLIRIDYRKEAFVVGPIST